MYYETYIDMVFVTNLLMDYILLRIVGRLCRCKGSWLRCLLGAGVGAAFSCAALLIPGEVWLPVSILVHGGCAVAMLRIGYGLKKGSLLAKGVLALYLTAFLCGGFWEAVRKDGPTSVQAFLLAALGTYLGGTALVYLSDSLRTRMKNLYPITLSYQGKVQSAYGFYDTGNLLSEPVSGEPVSIAKPEFIEAILSTELTGKLKHLKENPGELLSTDLAGLQPHYLSCRTVGGDGLLLAIRLDDLCIHTPREVVHISRPVFALSFEPSALGNEYKVLLNSRLLH